MKEVFERAEKSEKKPPKIRAERLAERRRRGHIPFLKGCPVCERSRAKKKSHKKLTPKAYVVKKKGGGASIDLCGPLHTGNKGERYDCVIVCGKTKTTPSVPLKNKKPDEILKALKRWCVLYGSPAELRSDNGSEFRSPQVVDWCVRNGATRSFAAPYTPQQNGIVEVRNSVLMGVTRCLLADCSLGPEFWPLAVQAAAYLRNRVPSSNASLSP